MNDLNPQPHIRWPALPERYDQALRAAIDFILDRFEPVGIVAAGAILRGRPDPFSDLDLYVIHTAPFRQRIQRLFHGVPAEIFVNPPQAVQRYLEEEYRLGRPITASMLVSGHVMLETGPLLSELRRTAAAHLYRPVDNRPETLTYARYLAALKLEDALDVVERDPATAEMLLSRAVMDMLEYMFLRDGRFYPRAKDLVDFAGRIDDAVGDLAREFFTSAGLQRRVELAGQIADRTLGARGFFEWESAPENV